MATKAGTLKKATRTPLIAPTQRAERQRQHHHRPDRRVEDHADRVDLDALHQRARRPPRRAPAPTPPTGRCRRSGSPAACRWRGGRRSPPGSPWSGSSTARSRPATGSRRPTMIAISAKKARPSRSRRPMSRLRGRRRRGGRRRSWGLRDRRGRGSGGWSVHQTSPEAAMMRSLATSGPNSAAMRPLRMTTMRWATDRHSLTSEVEKTTARPALAPSARRRNTSALAPTSMPRDGSSSRITRGWVASILPITTFCWLPPDSEPIGAPAAGGLDAGLADAVVDHRPLRWRGGEQPLGEGHDRGERQVLAHRHGLHEPVALAVLGDQHQPRGDAPRDRLARHVPALQQDPPRRRASRPATASSSSVRPAPISP